MPRNQEIAKWLEVSSIFFLWQLDHQKLRKHNPSFGDPADCEGKACQKRARRLGGFQTDWVTSKYGWIMVNICLSFPLKKMGEGFQTNDFEVKYTLLMIGSSVTAKLGQNQSFSVWWLVCQPTQQTFTHTFTWGRAIFKLSQILSWFSLLDLEDVPFFLVVFIVFLSITPWFQDI